MGEQTIARQLDAEIVLDMRPDLENGGEPFVRVMEAALAMRSDIADHRAF